MPDFVMPDGKEITFNLKAVTRGDLQNFVRVGTSFAEENEFLAKVTGLKADVIAGLDMEAFNELTRNVLRACTNPFFGARPQVEPSTTP